MRNTLRSISFTILTGTVLLFSACSKKEDTPPTATATTGALDGTVSPAGSITTVTATNAGGLTFPATPNASTGAFAVASLAPGSYTLSFAPAAGFAAPANRTITVVAGATASAGTVQVDRDGSVRGTVSWAANGATFTATVVSGSISILGGAGQSLSLTGAATSGTTTETVSFLIGNFSPVVSQYQLGNSPYQTAAYQRTSGGIITGAYGQLGTSSSAAGTFNITAANATARTFSGTFGFVAAANAGSTGSATITNGTFSLSY
jgi:hypothetical protein